MALHHPQCDCALCVEARKESYRQEREAIARKTPEDEARSVLRTELEKQPNLSIWYTAEHWKIELEPILEKLGYLGPKYTEYGFARRDILSKAKELLNEEPSER